MQDQWRAFSGRVARGGRKFRPARWSGFYARAGMETAHRGPRSEPVFPWARLAALACRLAPAYSANLVWSGSFGQAELRRSLRRRGGLCMNARHLQSHACPQCGAKVWRVHRHLSDRLASLFHNVHRYRCRDVSCGWEGTVPRPPTQHAGARGLAVLRSVDPKWIVLGLAAAVIGVVGIKLQRSTSVAVAPPQACNIAAAPRYVPAGESYDGVELPQETVNRALDAAGLSIRSGCAWGVPGRSPYKGSVKEALVAARLPQEVVHKIDAMVERGAVSDRVEIRRNSIRTRSGKRHFDTKIVAMGFGRTMCFGTHVNFEPGHVEIADLYDATDANGTTFSVMVPYVCGNVSVLAERAERPDVMGASSPESGGPAARPAAPGLPAVGGGGGFVSRRTGALGAGSADTGGGGVWVSPEIGPTPETQGGGETCVPEKGAQTVPEPGTLTIVIAAFLALAASRRIGVRRTREGRKAE